MAEFSDFDSQQAAIDRQRKLAAYLQQQSLTPEQGQMVSGHYVPPSNWAYLNKVAQALVGGSNQRAADEQQSALKQRMNTDRMGAIERYSDLLQGKEAVAPQLEKQTADTIGPPQMIAPGQAGVAPNRRAAVMELMKAQDPALQQFGMQQMLKEPAASKFSTTPHYDQQGRAFVMNEQGQMKYLDGVKSRDKMENVNGVWQNPYAQGENALAPADPNKAFVNGPNGPVANTPFQQYELAKAKAGKTDVSVKTDIKMNEGLANQVGPMMKDSAIAANGAVQQIDSADRIIKAIDTNKVYAGPMASTRLKMAQIGDVLGISGADTKEKIANTRQAIRGLSEMTLQGRKSMRGEGAITESEGKLAERAFSGDLDELTPAEVKQLAKASDRAAKHLVNEHNRKIGVMQKTPGLDGVTPFFQPITIPGLQTQEQTNVRSAADAILNGGK